MFWRKLYQLLFPLPHNCPVCMRPMKTLQICSECRQRMMEKRKLYGQCQRCGSFGVTEAVCKTCRDWGENPKKNLALWPHEDKWQQVVLDYKFRGNPWLAEALAGELTGLLTEEYDLIVPVPLHPNRFRERGYNQSLLLAKGIARRSGIPWEEVLLRIRDTVHQTGGNRELRLHNLKNAFQVSDYRRVQGKKILLVDDVLTTGATMQNCANALIEAGAESVTGITLTAGKTMEAEEMVL